MSAQPFAITAQFATDLPPPAARWGGFADYHFIGGNNDPDGVPVDGLIEAARRVLEREGRSLSTYNLDSGPQGYLPLRRFVADKARRQRGIDCSADDVLLTSGSLQAIDLVNKLFLRPGDTVIAERFSYGGVLTTFRRLGVNVVGVPLDEQGLRTDELKRILAELRGRGVRPKYLYTIPTVQNPTAAVMGETRRRELLAIAAEFDLAVFEDECYADLLWRGERPPALRALDQDRRVVHIGSFSKSIAPALRVGYVIADWPVLAQMLACKTDAGSGALEQMVLAEYCRQHFDDHVAALNRRLQQKAQTLCAALDQYFGTSAQFTAPDGGIFLWVTLPPQVDAMALYRAALDAGVAVNPGPEWSTDAAPAGSSLRICFAQASHETLRAGVARLAEVCQREFGVPDRIANVDRGAGG